MSSAIKLPPPSSSSSLVFFFRHGKCSKRQGRLINPISSSLFRPRNRRKTPKSSRDQDLQLVLDLDDAALRASASVRTFFRSSQSKFRRLLSSGSETISDLQTLVTFDPNGRIVIACRRSSLEFLAALLVWSFVAVFAVRFLLKLGFRSGFGGLDSVRRRDRSLAGREVVVGKRFREKKGFKKVVTPLSDVGGSRREKRVREGALGGRASREELLPSWWPDSLPSPVLTMAKEEFQREANRLVKAIMDNRMSGKDLTEDDIIQLRRICKTSGARISIDTANARDSFYRTSVDYVLNQCSVTCRSTLVQIDGEEARQFIAGLADNIGLDKVRAAKIVCAAVAARTRSRFLQAWAFEMQGKRSEALDELLKICRIHQIFPPEQYSPETEMVAQGLRNHLKLEQREHLFKLLEQACGPEIIRTAVEALGLENSTKLV